MLCASLLGIQITLGGERGQRGGISVLTPLPPLPLCSQESVTCNAWNKSKTSQFHVSNVFGREGVQKVVDLKYKWSGAIEKSRPNLPVSFVQVMATFVFHVSNGVGREVV